MMVTLKIVLWDVMLCVTLILVAAGSMLLWNTGVVSKQKAIFLQSLNFQILCFIFYALNFQSYVLVDSDWGKWLTMK